MLKHSKRILALLATLAVLPLLSRTSHAVTIDLVTVGNAGNFCYVPEPCTLILLSVGALVLLAYGYRRRRKA